LKVERLLLRSECGLLGIIELLAEETLHPGEVYAPLP
jgi:hypothetical protein